MPNIESKFFISFATGAPTMTIPDENWMESNTEKGNGAITHRAPDLGRKFRTSFTRFGLN